MNTLLVPKFVKLEMLSLKSSQEVNERWVQQVIENDPTVLGLGDVVVIGRERSQTGGGRLDLLLQDQDGTGRYTVELQLGSTDESHIIRALEYWDREKKRPSQFTHTAVIVAEEITGRFFNVIGLFNGFIPLIAIQMTVIRQPEGFGILFTHVLDTTASTAPETEPEPPTDRNYWETEQGTPRTVQLVDKLLEIIHTFRRDAALSYNKFYIGIWIDGKACNFASFRPRKNVMVIAISLPKTDELDAQLERSGLDVLEYDKQWKQYRIKLKESDIAPHRDLLCGLLNQACNLRKKE